MNHFPHPMSAGRFSAWILLSILLASLIACRPPQPSPPSDTVRDISTGAPESPSEVPWETDAATTAVTVTAPHESLPPLESAAESILEEETAEPSFAPETESEAESESESEAAVSEEIPKELPTDGEAYVLGDPQSSTRGIERYLLFEETHRHYLGENFTLYGLYLRQDQLHCLTFGTNMSIPLVFNHEAQLPEEGAFVKLSAVYTTSNDEWDSPSTFACMQVFAVEILQEPETEEPTAYVAVELLYVRPTPDSGDGTAPIAALPKGTPVRILETSCGSSGEWCRIAFDGDVGHGYVKAVYLTEEPIT